MGKHTMKPARSTTTSRRIRTLVLVTKLMAKVTVACVRLYLWWHGIDS